MAPSDGSVSEPNRAQARVLLATEDGELCSRLAGVLRTRGIESCPIPADVLPDRLDGRPAARLLVIADVDFGGQVLERLTAVKERRSDLAVLVLSSRPTIPLASAVIRGGAEDLVPIPCSDDLLVKEVERILDAAELRDRVENLHRLVADTYSLDRIVSRSARMRPVFERARAAPRPRGERALRAPPRGFLRRASRPRSAPGPRSSPPPRSPGRPPSRLDPPRRPPASRVRKDGLSGPRAVAAPVEETKGAFPPSTKTWGLMALTRRPTASVEARDPEDEVFAWPHLLYRELLVALGVVIVLHAASLVFMAPLEEMADPTRTPNPAKAPWYFLGLQELVHYSAFVGGVLVPTLIVVALLVLPYVDRHPGGAGRWFAPERRVANAVFTVLAAVGAVLTVIGTFFRGPNWAWTWPW